MTLIAERAATSRAWLGARLARAASSAALAGWVGPLLVTALGTWLRFDHLATPQALVFDESYYVPQALGIMRYGAEHAISSQTSTLILGGHANIFIPGGLFAAHPPFGKVQIASGEWLFGLSPFGWRFAAALAGSASILLLARIARRMTGSTLLGCVAGLLLALDGLEFVLSRTAMLDIFVMFWVLAGFGCLLIDRDRVRDRLTGRAAGASQAGPGPRLGVRWWRLGAGVCLGLAVASKWNGLFYLVLALPLAIGWDLGARRAAGLRYRHRALARDGAAALAGLWLTAAVAYVATWSGWFASSTGWDRNYAAAHGVRTPVVSALYSLWAYHRQMFSYGLALHTSQTFTSAPWTWLALKQPVPFYYGAPPYGVTGCRALTGCVQDVLAIGTPAIWWAAIPALAAIAAWWLLRRDWRAGVVLLGVAAGWLPWFALGGRPEFLYYAVPFEPFLILALTLCLALILGGAAASPLRRGAGIAVAAAYLVVVAVSFSYLYPVLAGSSISHSAWLARMWWPNWM
jgi:dolichyl-phosphate-mannose--protein O-mannosyl transferase